MVFFVSVMLWIHSNLFKEVGIGLAAPAGRQGPRSSIPVCVMLRVPGNSRAGRLYVFAPFTSDNYEGGRGGPEYLVPEDFGTSWWAPCPCVFNSCVVAV